MCNLHASNEFFHSHSPADSGEIRTRECTVHKRIKRRAAVLLFCPGENCAFIRPRDSAQNTYGIEFRRACAVGDVNTENSSGVLVRVFPSADIRDTIACKPVYKSIEK